MTEVVTPSGKGCSYGTSVSTEIRSRVQLFMDQGIDYVRLCLEVIPLGVDKTPECRTRTLMRMSVFARCS